MENVILAVHILACIAMTVVVLLQRSEGGALGIGGGSGSMFSGRGAAGALVRTTMIFGGIFFVTSLVLTTLASRDPERSAVERAVEGTGDSSTVPLDVLDPDADLLGDGDRPAAPGEAADPLAPEPDPAAQADTPAADTGETEVDPFADEPGNTGDRPN